MKKKLYAVFPFIPQMNLSLGRKIHAIKLKLNEKNIRKELVNATNIYANVGCGGAGLAEGWVNIDYMPYLNVNYLFDCRKDIPFNNHTVKGLFTDHFFEHIDYETEAPEFLKNCHRVLQAGCILRMIVPDAEKFLQGYCTRG